MPRMTRNATRASAVAIHTARTHEITSTSGPGQAPRRPASERRRPVWPAAEPGAGLGKGRASEEAGLATAERRRPVCSAAEPGAGLGERRWNEEAGLAAPHRRALAVGRAQRNKAVTAVVAGAMVLLAACGGGAAPGSAPASVAAASAKPAASSAASAAGSAPAKPAASGAASAAAKPDSSAKPGQVTVRVGLSSASPSNAGAYLADGLGFFDKQGIHVEHIIFNAASAVAPAMASNQVDVADVGVNPAMFNTMAAALGAKLVGDKGSMPKGFGFTSFMVR